MFLKVHIMVLWFMTLCSGHETYFVMFLSDTTLHLGNLHCTHLQHVAVTVIIMWHLFDVKSNVCPSSVK